MADKETTEPIEPIEPIIPVEPIEEKVEKPIDSTSLDWQAHNHNGINSSKINDASVDHGSISGLTDDDHTSYHTDARGDARYTKKDGSVAYTGTGAGFRDEDAMTSDDATAAASQQSIKKYVDDSVPSNVIVLNGVRENFTDAANLFTAQVNYNSTNGNLVWATNSTVAAKQNYVVSATKPPGFAIHMTAKVVNGVAQLQHGIVEVGSYVYVNDDTNDITRYDKETLANAANWAFDQNGFDGKMAYDGTYVYIINTGTPNQARRYTIDAANSQFDHDTGWVTGADTFKTLPESISRGFFADATYLYGFDMTDKKIYKIHIANNTADASIAFNTNYEASYEKGDICGIVQIGTQWYCFYDVLTKEAADTLAPTTIIGIPFSW